ncbi:hypothetical protein ALQ89_100238 [Pseudomonas amygdali pv. tabaci]|uniref:Uncharacterized protein n=1 Tax=Pseudomonas amygdali pv. tabaci TaxID=322 RepID=A0AAX1VVS9_PSEAJ|nr:hypothetical protein ALO60_101077 [Pseudomonas amygdali pv. tabaci]RML81229.1 hypothetical protein ALQ89_100238 [Pseudomonas amygdali pv. tabaci]RMR90743.1 hypothetical protein ALP77_101012 [Pseudomonas amygdali pv. tabaci]
MIRSIAGAPGRENWKRAIIPTDPARLNVNLSLLSKLFIDAH